MSNLLPYRTFGEPGLVVTEKERPRGLVRANGYTCRCYPPGRLYCWWYEVRPGDRWYCEHGGGWIRKSHHGTPYLRDHWAAPLKECVDEDEDDDD